MLPADTRAALLAGKGQTDTSKYAPAGYPDIPTGMWGYQPAAFNLVARQVQYMIDENIDLYKNFLES